MSVTESILRHQLDGGVFENEEQMVDGIARRAVDPAHGYESLSAAQKRVLQARNFLPHGSYHQV